MFDLQLNLICALLLGCGAGIFTGLAPGIHTNTIAAGVLATLPFFLNYFSPLALCVFLVAMVMVHSFTSYIPSIFLGAPDDGETALSVLPGHRMLLAGHGYDALKLTVVGGIGTTFIGLLTLPLFYLFVKNFYNTLSWWIPFGILAFSAYFILIELGLKKKVWALIVFLLSGVLGLLALNQLPLKEPLFPLLTGLFGTSTILISMTSKNKIVEQFLSEDVKFQGNWLLYLKASICAALMSVLPALGAAQATVLAQALSKKRSGSDFLIMTGGISTVSSLFVLSTLYLIGRARTGVLAVMKQFFEIDFSSMLVLMVASLVALGISVIVTLLIGRFVAKRISKIKYRKLSFFVLLLLVILCILFAGWLGLFMLTVSTAVGLIAPKVEIKRIHAMGCLAIPIVSYFI